MKHSLSIVKPSRKLVVACLIGLIVTVFLAFGSSNEGLQPGVASAASTGPAQSLDIANGSGGFCNGSICFAGVGSSFTLQMSVDEAPASGYIVMQTFLDFSGYDPAGSEDGAGPGTCSDGIDNDGLNNGEGLDIIDLDCLAVELVFKPALTPADNIVWPDLAAATAIVFEYDPSAVEHLIGLMAIGGITGVFPPLPASAFEGVVVELEMTCPSTPVQTSVAILASGHPIAGTVGAVFVEPDLTQTAPKVDSITINCVDQQAHPGDTDGDGCSDVRESGSDPMVGGLRDWLNPWDFYDVATVGGVPGQDGKVDLFNDIVAVVDHYAPLGTEPEYDVRFDRGPSAGPNAWNMTAPDGKIDLVNDILGVISQLFHDCN